MIENCISGGDEYGCDDPPASDLLSKQFVVGLLTCPETHFQCAGNGFCLPAHMRCNGVFDCPGREDEAGCDYEDGITCPEAQFQCAGNGYCLLAYLRCNGVFDCPDHEDETGCDRKDDVTCPGFYRCRRSAMCLHPSDVCDGVPRCPDLDDELLCDVTCPHNCTCLGLAFQCQHSFPAEEHAELRYLDGDQSGMQPRQFYNNTMLVFLSLANCSLTDESLMGVPYLPNLRTLDVKDNMLTTVRAGSVSALPNLRHVSLANNKLVLLFPDHAFHNVSLQTVVSVDLSGVPMDTVDMVVLAPFTNLLTLNLSSTGLKRIEAFTPHQSLSTLQTVDLRGCALENFPRTLFREMNSLLQIHADVFRVCCPSNLPLTFDLKDCHSPEDEISSCDNLLRSTFNRVVMSTLATLTLIMNTVTICVRVRSHFSK
jgi:hypothetical protein